MAFSKSSRFNYKVLEEIPSPADYVIVTKLDQGCKISRAERFSKTLANQDNTPKICSRMTRSYNHSRTYEKENLTNKKLAEINKKDNVNTRGKSRQGKCMAKENKTPVCPKLVRHNLYCSTPISEQGSIKNHLGLGRNKVTDGYGEAPFKNKKPTTSKHLCYLFESEEFFYDDYESLMHSKELRKLENLEKNDFRTVYKTFQEVPEGNSMNKPKHVDVSVDVVVNEQTKSEKDMTYYKSQAESLLSNNSEKNTDPIRAEKSYHANDLAKTRKEIENIVKEIIEQLWEAFEKIQTPNRIFEDKIKDAMNYISASANKSDDIKLLCQNIAKDLSTKLNKLVQDVFADEQAKERAELLKEPVILDQLQRSCKDDEALLFDITNITRKCNNTQEMLEEGVFADEETIEKPELLKGPVIQDRLETSPKDDEALLIDITNITRKCNDTQEMLETQRSFIEAITIELAHLKCSVYYNK